MEESAKIILYVDDDADDREFLSIAIKNEDPAVEIVLAENGLSALDYLKTAKETRNHLPCLIILDINMPYLDGKQTLVRLRKDPGFSSVPVVVFTSSESPEDKAFFGEFGIEMITKPSNINYLSSIAGRLLRTCA